MPVVPRMSSHNAAGRCVRYRPVVFRVKRPRRILGEIRRQGPRGRADGGRRGGRELVPMSIDEVPRSPAPHREAGGVKPQFVDVLLGRGPIDHRHHAIDRRRAVPADRGLRCVKGMRAFATVSRLSMLPFTWPCCPCRSRRSRAERRSTAADRSPLAAARTLTRQRRIREVDKVSQARRGGHAGATRDSNNPQSTATQNRMRPGFHAVDRKRASTGRSATGKRRQSPTGVREPQG